MVMERDQTATASVTRRQFGSIAAAAAAGWLLPACGPSRLHDLPRGGLHETSKKGGGGWRLTACGPRRLYDVPRDELREAIKKWEREYSERYGKAVTVSDDGP